MSSTHVHADHLSAGRELAAAAGAEYILHASAGARFPFRAVEDGDVLSLGNVDARVLHLPGHTPEHLALVVTDRCWTWQVLGCGRCMEAEIELGLKVCNPAEICSE